VQCINQMNHTFIDRPVKPEWVEAYLIDSR
jgi:hypothetical protein